MDSDVREPADPAITRVAVLGTGTIGASWASLFLAQGLEVAASDPSPGAETRLRRYVDDAWPSLEAIGAVRVGASPTRLTFDPRPQYAVEGRHFVQESGPERLTHKRELFAELDAVLPPDALIASSTSGLAMSDIQSACARPERCVIGHPFNPPHLVPLVEVVPGAKTSAQTLRRATAFYRSIGKYPIQVLKEVPGHIANRLQAALWREAAHLAMQGVASVADIDAAVAYGPGLRWALMGPSLTFHLAGGDNGLAHFLEHLGPAVQTWWSDLGAPELSDDMRSVLVEGVTRQVGGTSVRALASERDRLLVQLLQVVRAKQVLC